MLKINRIKAILKTEDDNYSFDYKLSDGLNLISSTKNTRGKSSAILAIYYCLGFEEIIGGKGMKTLTSVYKNTVEDESDTSHNVLESEMLIEISNGTDIVTLLRAGKMEGRNENLITVYYSNMDSIFNSETFVEDMYIHAAHSTTSSKGFHGFLEKFIGFELPLVPNNEGTEYKLYMQLIFSIIFIEQKRGWADLFSAMPVLGIREAKKRVIEYILDLDTLANEKKRAKLRIHENDICNKWEALVNEIFALCNREDCKINSLPNKPKIVDKELFFDTIQISTIEQNPLPIDDKLFLLETEKESLKGTTPKIVDNYEKLQEELKITEEGIERLEFELKQQQDVLTSEKAIVSKLEENLETINNDLRNNKDALKLKEMGSALGAGAYSGICPVCHQHIEDSLLPSQSCDHVMSIEVNIKHLDSQKSMITYALNAHKNNKNSTDENIQSIIGRIFTLRRLAKTIRNDLFSVDDNISEAVVYKRIQLENKIQALNTLKESVEKKISEMIALSDKWKTYLEDKSKLPKANFSETDGEKIITLEKNFKQYLRAFDYHSISDYRHIQISQENYLPTSEGFDMKFGSSASDNIRAIWAYTLALLRTSIEKGGTHPQILIFDEPAQHSIVTNDVISLFNAMVEIPGSKQIILGITFNDEDVKKAVEEFDQSNINIIDVGYHALKKIE
jgi:hypothetical protein